MQTSTDKLEDAIVLVKQSKFKDAQPILEEILSADPHHLPAWHWYVQTYPTKEKRIKAFELCLKYNPDNEQVKQTLKKLKLDFGKDYPTPPKNVPQTISLESDDKTLGDLLFVIVYVAAIISFIAGVRAAVYDIPWKEQQGFGGLGLIFIVGGFLITQWMAITGLSSLYTIMRTKQKLIKDVIVRMGLCTAIIFIIIAFLLALSSFSDSDISVNYFFFSFVYLIFSFLQTVPFLFVFGFVSGSGIATFIVWVFDLLAIFLRGISKLLLNPAY